MLPLSKNVQRSSLCLALLTLTICSLFKLGVCVKLVCEAKAKISAYLCSATNKRSHVGALYPKHYPCLCQSQSHEVTEAGAIEKSFNTHPGVLNMCSVEQPWDLVITQRNSEPQISTFWPRMQVDLQLLGSSRDCEKGHFKQFEFRVLSFPRATSRLGAVSPK